MKWSSQKACKIIRTVNTHLALLNWQGWCYISSFCMVSSSKILKMKDSAQTFLLKATLKKNSAFKWCLFLKWRRKPHFVQLWMLCNKREKSRKWACFYNFLREEESFKSWNLLQCSFQMKCLSRIFHFECFARWEHAKSRKTATFLPIRKRKRWVSLPFLYFHTIYRCLISSIKAIFS